LIGLVTSIKKAKRTTEFSVFDTATMNSLDTSRTFTGYFSPEGSEEPTYTFVILTYGVTSKDFSNSSFLTTLVPNTAWAAPSAMVALKKTTA
jgi:hypothetical protein